MSRFQWVSCVVFALAVAAAGAADTALEQQLRRTIIPRISFEEAPLADVLDAFRKRGQELDADGRPVNIVFLGAATALQELRVTMMMDNIPLSEALRYTAQAAGLTMTVDPNAVVLTTPAKKAMAVDVRVVPAKEAHQYVVEFRVTANGSVVSAPKVLTLAGHEARIQIGSEESPGIVGTALVTEHDDGGGTAHTTLRHFDDRGKLTLSVVQDVSIGKALEE